MMEIDETELEVLAKISLFMKQRGIRRFKNDNFEIEIFKGD